MTDLEMEEKRDREETVPSSHAANASAALIPRECECAFVSKNESCSGNSSNSSTPSRERRAREKACCASGECTTETLKTRRKTKLKESRLFRAVVFLFQIRRGRRCVPRLPLSRRMASSPRRGSVSCIRVPIVPQDLGSGPHRLLPSLFNPCRLNCFRLPARFTCTYTVFSGERPVFPLWRCGRRATRSFVRISAVTARQPLVTRAARRSRQIYNTEKY